MAGQSWTVPMRAPPCTRRAAGPRTTSATPCPSRSGAPAEREHMRPDTARLDKSRDVTKLVRHDRRPADGAPDHRLVQQCPHCRGHRVFEHLRPLEPCHNVVVSLLFIPAVGSTPRRSAAAYASVCKMPGTNRGRTLGSSRPAAQTPGRAGTSRQLAPPAAPGRNVTSTSPVPSAASSALASFSDGCRCPSSMAAIMDRDMNALLASSCWLHPLASLASFSHWPYVLAKAQHLLVTPLLWQWWHYRDRPVPPLSGRGPGTAEGPDHVRDVGISRRSRWWVAVIAAPEQGTRRVSGGTA